MESLIRETRKGRNMRGAACAARYIMQTARVAVSNTGTMLLLSEFLRKNSHFLTALLERPHASVGLSVIYSFFGVRIFQ